MDHRVQSPLWPCIAYDDGFWKRRTQPTSRNEGVHICKVNGVRYNWRLARADVVGCDIHRKALPKKLKKQKGWARGGHSSWTQILCRLFGLLVDHPWVPNVYPCCFLRPSSNNLSGKAMRDLMFDGLSMEWRISVDPWQLLHWLSMVCLAYPQTIFWLS